MYRLIAKGARIFAGVLLVLLVLGTLTAAQAQSQAEKNKKIAVAFLTMIFNDHKVEEAFKLYAVPEYKQHNPYAATGAQAAINFLGPYLKANPEARTDIKRVIAEGDLVAIHNNPKQNAKDRGSAVVDIFRLENGKVVEHWDVVQEVAALVDERVAQAVRVEGEQEQRDVRVILDVVARLQAEALRGVVPALGQHDRQPGRRPPGRRREPVPGPRHQRAGEERPPLREAPANAFFPRDGAESS